jgi:hypothetical protein
LHGCGRLINDDVLRRGCGLLSRGGPAAPDVLVLELLFALEGLLAAGRPGRKRGLQLLESVAVDKISVLDRFRHLKRTFLFGFEQDSLLRHEDPQWRPFPDSEALYYRHGNPNRQRAAYAEGPALEEPADGLAILLIQVPALAIGADIDVGKDPA